LLAPVCRLRFVGSDFVGTGFVGTGFVGTGAYPGAVTEDDAASDGSRERFDDLVDQLVGTEGVTPPQGGSGFGRSALRFQGKIFAMHVRGALVVKLPAERVEALVRAGEGVHFDANKGTPMREWLSLDPGSGQPWLPLATEALDFARSVPRSGSSPPARRHGARR
jgi:hypothetical protein